MPEQHPEIQSQILHVMSEWRRGQVDKQRGIASFAERAQLRFDAIRDAAVVDQVPLTEWQIRRYHLTGVNQYEYIEDWTTVRQGEVWGEGQVGAFFKRTVEIPERLAGRRVYLRMHLGGDALVRIGGQAYQALDPFHYEVLLTEQAEGGQRYEIEVESSLNYHLPTGPPRRLVLAELAVVDMSVREAMWDLWAVAKVLQVPNIDPVLASFVEYHLWEAMKHVPLREPDFDRFREGLSCAQEQVRRTIYDNDRFRLAGQVHLVGHSHLDVVYQWPYREFCRKVGRTHSTMLRLMEQYPEFRFCQSQAKTYADMKRYYPELFEQVRQRVREGRWEIVGAFWVEPDCNIISGESFVRQTIYGQRFFEREFGVRARTCWQPDVFGLCWALPQILHRSGIEYFMTNKMVVWADTNPWQEHVFWWEGPDGSRVLGVVPPGHFIGTVEPKMIDTQWRRYSARESVGQMMHIYGWGDGGGGPDEEMIECGRRYASMAGMPPAKFNTAEGALDEIAEHAHTRGNRLPVLRDEIYLEAHRGTYTTKGRLKKLNRRGELLLRDAELLASWAALGGADYPADTLDEAWMMLLTTQFHDSLPGTHVPPVYPDLLAEHEQIRQLGTQVRERALDRVCGEALAADGPGQTLAVFNTALHERSDLVSVDPAELGEGMMVTDAEGAVLPQQTVTDLDGTVRRIVRVPGVPGAGWRAWPVAPADAAPGDGDLKVTENTLENARLRATFNGDGEIVELYDKVNDRSALAEGERGNRLFLYEDTPGRYDAWDIVETYRDHPIDIGGGELSIDERGPLRASLRLERPVAGSRLRQRICLYAHLPMLVFETEVDWQERQRLLKVGFPLDLNTDHATYDVPFGNMQRSSQHFQSNQRSRFEVPAHWWMDMSQSDYGVSLLNDCKYGHEADGTLMRLTLLKGSISPDPESDLEMHHFTYALYPHAGDWQAARTIQHATEMNVPLVGRVLPGRPAGSDRGRLLACDSDALTLEAVKWSEDARHLVVRLCERHNRRLVTRLRFDRPVRAAWSCDLMEQAETELTCEGHEVAIDVGPRQITTLRVDL